MIQTVYSKDHFDFSSFGLTIIDEVHRIGSEQFSRTLFKVITRYMLGISATVERKDKLSRMLFMFVGPKLYSEQRQGDNSVEVRGLVYEHSDPEFNECLYDGRGNCQYSRMISKLCEFVPRRRFVTKVVRDLLLENPDSQIIVLCHNRNLLDAMFEDLNDGVSPAMAAAAAAAASAAAAAAAAAMKKKKKKKKKNIVDEEEEQEEGIPPPPLPPPLDLLAGFYVGGMKAEALQKSEKKKVVLATYAMAAEGLDIKTLTTLVMVTPKTDITQSVGRILRTKHEKPIIVDLIDAHEVFQNQWKKRRVFYRQNKYVIKLVESVNYSSMTESY